MKSVVKSGVKSLAGDWVLLFAAVLLLGLGGGTLSAQEIKENLDLPYDAIGDSEEDETAPETVLFYGLTLEGDGFFYTVDKSGSMAQGELPIAKKEIIRNITEFSERTQFAVNFFDTNVVKFPAGTAPVEATASHKQAAISFINGVESGHGSCCQKGLLEALRFANTCSARRKVIVYVGDGGGTCSGANEADYLKQTLLTVKTNNYQHVTINTIGVLELPPLNERFLRDLAAQNGGTYRRIH
jgi:Mg-chelatase subunit ChlD